MRKIREGIISLPNILYFDYTASGQAYAPIERKIRNILKTYANTHSEVSSNAKKTQYYYEKARKSLRKSLEIDDSFYILPCGTGATGAIKKFQEILGIYCPPMTKKRFNINPKELPLVLVGPYEHHSNEVSFREALCEIVRVPLYKDENIDISFLEKVLKENKNREIIASFSVASNVTGVLTEYKSLYKLIKSYGGIFCLDGAASSPYMNVDCNYYDALYLSPHKCLGGPGSCGILVIKKSLCKSDKPTFAGGGTVGYVSRTGQEYLKDIEIIEDAGTPGILQFIKASLAYELRNKAGLEKIKEIEDELKVYFGTKIRELDGVRLYCHFGQRKLPIFSLNVEGVHQDDLALHLSNQFGIQTRSGCSCAGPYGHDLLELKDNQPFVKKPGWLRISLHYTHTKDEIDILLNSIKESVKILRNKKDGL
ncbi:MAG: aminotransferase class V-fold PLP-dependent enzyme [Campylobacteraceae bacterium]|jgi:selenocysteine lyase/cysteine desulfurase|nr:aminotransferase class V-fold PLP-dependent enzyme [Campylobacteraceae bacterium]